MRTDKFQRAARDRRLILTYIAGSSLVKTGAAFAVSPERVREILIRYGVKRRQPWEKNRRAMKPMI